MIQPKSLFFLFISVLFCVTAISQNLTGIWRGSFFSPADLALGGSKYRYEVQINNNGREAKGVTYSYQTTRFYGKASLVGVWSPSSKNLVLQEDRMLDLKIMGGGDGCLMTCYLTYKKEGDKEYLEGSYTSANMNNKNQNCGGGKVFLEKVPDTDFELEDFLVKKKPATPSTNAGKVKPGQEDYLVKKPATPPPVKPKPPTTTKPPATVKTTPPATKQKTTTVLPPATKPPTTEKPNTDVVKTDPPKEVSKPTEPVKPKPLPPLPKVLKERENELFKTITTKERFVEISFYDNGEIDGDTISIFNNNRLVVSNKGLSAKPIVITIELKDDDPMQDIVMVAENLGTLPPNTALMIVQAGKERYTLNLSSTEQKNAMVRFKYQPD